MTLPDPPFDPPTAPTPRLMRLPDLLQEFGQDAQARYEAKKNGRPLGALTGLAGLDREIGGALAPGLHILHGAPGSGKSAFALQLASVCQCPALYVTCEMSPLELLRRMAARVTGQYLNRFKSGEFAPETALGYAKQACASAPLLALLDATGAPAPPPVLQTPIQAVRQLAPENPHLLIVVDSVHSWVRGWAGEGVTETESLIAGIDALRELAQRFGCAVVGIAERNRASMKSEGQNAAAGTRVFEYGSETVIALTPEAERPDAQGLTPIKLTLAKNRNGAPGKPISLRFHGALQRFTEVE